MSLKGSTQDLHDLNGTVQSLKRDSQEVPSPCRLHQSTVPILSKPTGDVLIEIGDPLLRVPHPVGKVVGIVLVAAGSALKLYVASQGESAIEVHVALTAEQLQQIQQALAMGRSSVTIRQADGQTNVFELKREAGPSMPESLSTTRPRAVR